MGRTGNAAKQATFAFRVVSLTVGLSLMAFGSPTAPLARARSAATSINSPNRLRFDKTRYASDACAGLVLADPSANADPGTAEEVSVTVESERGDSESVTLTETGVDSGRFQPASCLHLANAAVTQNDGTLQVSPGDFILTVEKSEAGDILTMDVALVNGGTDDGTVTITVDPTIFPEGFPTAAPSDLPPPNDAPFPIAMVEDPDGKTFFGADQVIYQPASQTELNDFIERHGGRLLKSLSVPVTVPGQQDVHASYSLIRLNPLAFDPSQTAYLMEKLGFEGIYTFSSDQAAHLIGLLLEEQITGSDVAPSSLMLPMNAPKSDEGLHNWFGQQWFDADTPPTSRVTAGQGLTVMAAADETRKVPTAFVDGGFAGPNDYQSPWPTPFDNPDYGTSFNNASRCSFDTWGGADCSTGAAAGTNPVLCNGSSACDWHGLDMFSIAGARLDNGFGAAGAGAQAVGPRLYKTTYPFLFSGSAAIERAVDDGARVMNVGTGFRCTIIVDFCRTDTAIALSAVICSEAAALSIEFPIVGALTCVAATNLLFGIVAGASWLEAVVNYANAAGVVVVASAGNDGGDAAADHMLPCTLSHVICVGALDATSSDLESASFSDYGSAVDLWAPGVGVPVTPDPDRPPTGPVWAVAGTSAAAAFVTGVVADIRSINPSLTAIATANVLYQSTCAINRAPRLDGTNCVPSSDPRLSQAGFVDVLETVRRARDSRSVSNLVPCTGGWDETSTAGDFATSAIPVNLGSTPAGGTHPVGSYMSIHAFPTDKDWYSFQVPNFGATTTDMTINLRLLGPETGKLEEQLIKVTASGQTITQTLIASAQTSGPQGVASLRYFFNTGTTYYLKVSAPSPEATNDACYSLGFWVHGAGPRPDRFEPNESKSAAASLGLVDDSHVHGLSLTSIQTEERWNKHVTGLTFDVPTDKDFFTARLPDPQDPAEDGHVGILECGLHKSPGGDTVYEAVAVASPTLSPSGTANVTYFDPANQPLGLVLANGGVGCPRRQLGSPYQLGIALSRLGATQPASYDLDLDYKIRITRQVPFAIAKALGEHLKFLSTLVGQGGCMVPRCPLEKIDLRHVIAPSQFGTCAPRCGELSLINLETTGKLDLTFSSRQDLSYQLLNKKMNVVMKGMPSALSSVRVAQDRIVKHMVGTIHRPGLYVLRVRGARGAYTMDIGSMPTGQRDVTIAAGAAKVRRGRRVRITGGLQCANPGCLAGSVLLQKKAPRQSLFRTVARKSVAADGSFSFFPRLKRTRDFRVVAPEAGACQRAVSPSIRINVR